MKSDCLLSIVIVNYNTRNLLQACLQSIHETSDVLGNEVIVVDNDSNDGSVDMVRKQFPDAKLLTNAINVGYSKAVNQAINDSSGRYVLILNADTVIKPGAIQSLLSFMKKNPDTGIAGPKLFFPDGRLQYSCRTFQTLKTILFRRTFLGRLFPNSKIIRDHLMSEWDHGSEKEVDWLLGAAILVRREAIEQVGLMDERYFLYLEDVDWCYRLKNSGWRVYYVPQAEMIHHYRQGSRSETRLNRDVLIHLASMFRYYDKWNNILYIIKKILSIIRQPLFMFSDVCFILLSFWLAFNLRESIHSSNLPPLYPISIYYKLLFVFSLTTILTFYLIGEYEIKRSLIWVDHFLMIVKGILISCFIMILFFLFSKGYRVGLLYSRVVLFSFLTISMLSLFLSHHLIFLLSRLLWRLRFNLKRTFIVGKDQTALSVKEDLSKQPEFGYEIVGFVSPDNEITNTTDSNFAGKVDQLVAMSHRERIQEVIFVNVDKYYEHIILPLIKCTKNFLGVRIISDDFKHEAVDPKIKDFFGFPSLVFECRPMYYVGLILKRTADVIISLFGIIVLLPAIFYITLRLKFEDGDAFFIQKRVGLNGKGFYMYKFRTMLPGAENQKDQLENIATNGPIFKAKNDPRVTRFGRFLRKYNLDEIPQLINVLKGEMSFIGPRPPLPEEVEQYEDWHKSRLEFKPGITGLWQVDKKRKWKFDEMVKLDIYYILNWSLLLDFKILLRTPGAILRGTGL